MKMEDGLPSCCPKPSYFEIFAWALLHDCRFQTVTAEAQHAGSKAIQETSKKYSVQSPTTDNDCFKMVIREEGLRKLLKMMYQQLCLE